MLSNIQNYYMYAPIAQGRDMLLNTGLINLGNWREYYDGLLNIMKDGIELEEVHRAMITLIFPTGENVEVSIPDLFINIILWYPVVALGETVGPQHLLIKDTFTAKDLKNYMDFHIIEPNRMKISNKTLNNVIADMICNFVDIDNFSMYLADTLNLEDDIVLMEKSPEFRELIHCNLANVPIEKVKNEGMKIVYKAMDIIMNSKNIMGYDHYLKNAFAAKEGINLRQYKENHYNIGTKPDGQGSIYHEIINQSYINGGLNKMIYQLIDSGSSRVAQIISKKNVGESGGFSRILGLNNVNSFLYPDPTYDCMTKNFIKVTIPNKEFLRRIKDRYYRIHPHGQEFLINQNDISLIGQTIYLRSPMTCASRAEGHGVCYRCYGTLAYTNSDINIGRIATELITSQYTQKRLSAKHLLETSIPTILWNEGFNNFFIVETNAIKPVEALTEAWEGYKLIIDPDQIQLENDDEFFQHKFFDNETHSLEDEGPFYNEFITEFILESPEGVEIPIGSIATESSPEAKMYFSSELTSVIREIVKINKQEDIDEERISVPMKLLEDKTLFFIKLQNNDLGKNLDIFNDLLNKKDVTKSHTKDQLLEKLLETLINGDIECQSVHLEVILSNQIKSAYDRLKEPNWLNENEEYELLTLNEALTDNPSVINSLIYQKLAKTLYYPLTYRKTAPSIFDLFFMRKPKKFLEADHEIHDIRDKSTIIPGELPMVFVREGQEKRPLDFSNVIKQARNKEKTELDD